MNAIKKLYDLQSIDVEIRNNQVSEKEIERRLIENEELNKLREDRKELEDKLLAISRQKKELEWQVASIQKNIKEVNSKLFGGSVKNPKELLSLQQELTDFKSKLNVEEDKLIELMSDEETSSEKSKRLKYDLAALEINWTRQKSVLSEEKKEIEKRIANLNAQRATLISEIEPDVFKIYEKIFGKKGCAIVRIEQGRCQGCRLALPMSDLQRARSGALVQCNSCGMILYSGQ